MTEQPDRPEPEQPDQQPPPHPPPPPGYGPGSQPGYQPGYPPGYPPGPAQMSPADERTWSLMAHLGALVFLLISGGFLGWLAPLLVLMIKGEQSQFVRGHAKEALNFQITVILVWLVGIVAGVLLTIVTVGIALVVLIPLAIAYVVFIFVVLILASVRANEGRDYRYPLSIRFVS